jgi:hypothetical protein
MKTVAIGMLIMLLCAAPGFAANGNLLTWSAPTTRTDGSAFNMATEGKEYKVNTVPKGQSVVTTVIKPKEAVSMDITSYGGGTRFTIQACDLNGLCSDDSVQVTKTGKPDKPDDVEIE